MGSVCSELFWEIWDWGGNTNEAGGFMNVINGFVHRHGFCFICHCTFPANWIKEKCLDLGHVYYICRLYFCLPWGGFEDSIKFGASCLWRIARNGNTWCGFEDWIEEEKDLTISDFCSLAAQFAPQTHLDSLIRFTRWFFTMNFRYYNFNSHLHFTWN